MRRFILYFRFITALFALFILTECKQEKSQPAEENKSRQKIAKDTLVTDDTDTEQLSRVYSMENVPASFTELVADTLGIIVDLRYATENNFTKKQIYDCPRCFFRKEVAEKIIAAHLDLKERYGFGIKLFDCYRPSAYQKKLWEIVPDPNYVTPPAKGSVHSRGMAVDLTIVDKQGKELDMGTGFDFFGKEAHTDYYELPDNVLKNRQLLKKIMEIHGFRGIRTEWWHYSYRNLKGKINHWVWTCE